MLMFGSIYTRIQKTAVLVISGFACCVIATVLPPGRQAGTFPTPRGLLLCSCCAPLRVCLAPWQTANCVEWVHRCVSTVGVRKLDTLSGSATAFLVHPAGSRRKTASDFQCCVGLSLLTGAKGSEGDRYRKMPKKEGHFCSDQ